MRHRLVLHPVLMAVFPVLFLYAANINQAQIGDVVLPTLVSLGAALALWGLWALVLRSLQAAALMVTLFILAFASYGHVFNSIAGFSIGSIVVGRSKLLLPLWLLLFTAGILLILRAHKKGLLAEWTRGTHIFTALLVVVPLAQIVMFHVQRGFPEPVPRTSPIPGLSGKSPDDLSDTSGSASQDLPDIYYIIPDSYDANSSLKEFFGFDNRAFTDYLESKGFFIASQSTSNYAFTGLSLPSSLNMQYLNLVAQREGAESKDASVLVRMMADNEVMRFLKSRGYTLINAGSWWGPTESNRNAHINLRSGYLNDFNIKLLRSTLLFPFMEEITEDVLRKKVLFTFENLAAIPRMEAPTFAFVHIICPHPPFVFGPEGEKVSSLRRILAKPDPRALYRDQVLFVNKMLRASVEKILAESRTPPIIIIQGDHGAAYAHRTHPRTGLPDDAYLREQMRIFNAYYLPGVKPGAIPESITPVNSFRVVFNEYFGQKLPLLPDESFYSTKTRPYALTNVTEKVDYKQ